MTHRARHRSLALTLLLGTGLGLTAGSVPAASAGTAPASVAFTGAARVGALFAAAANGRPGRHFCTAAVVDSPGRNLLVTAAHCVLAAGSGRTRGGLVFVPGYTDGNRPYGSWPVTRVIADARWSEHGDPDYDVAFLTVARSGTGRLVQDVVGSEAIGFNTPRGGPAVAVGYPIRTERPVRCASRLRGFGPRQLEFDCAGLPGGTSGGPLLTGAGPTATGRGTVVGVIGGHQEGGYTDDVSYSPYFGPGIAGVYRAAVRQG